MAVGQEPLLLGIYDSVCPQVTLSPFENKIGGLPVRFSCKYLILTNTVRIFFQLLYYQDLHYVLYVNKTWSCYYKHIVP